MLHTSIIKRLWITALVLAVVAGCGGGQPPKRGVSQALGPWSVLAAHQNEITGLCGDCPTDKITSAERAQIKARTAANIAALGQKRSIVFPKHRTTIFVNAGTGNDTTCKRGLAAFPCATLTKACAIGKQTDYIAQTTSAKFTMPIACSQARVFVSLIGTTNCTRSANPITYPAAIAAGSVCGPSSWSRANQISSQGDTIVVMSGIYPAFTISNDASKTSANGRCFLGALSLPAGTLTGGDTSGCVTFKPIIGGSVRSGTATLTTANFDMSSASTINVVSTAGFASDGTYYHLGLGNSPTDEKCTGVTATSFTGCDVHTDCWYSGGGSFCGWTTGTNIEQGNVTVSSSYVRLQNIDSGGYVAASPGTTDVIFDGNKALGFSAQANYVGITNFTTNGIAGQGASTSFNTNCTHCVFYKNTIKNLLCCGDINEGTLTANVTQGQPCGNSSCQCPQYPGVCTGGQNTNYYNHGDGVYSGGSSYEDWVSNTVYGNEGTAQISSDSSNPDFPNYDRSNFVNNFFGPCGPRGCSGGEIDLAIAPDFAQTITAVKVLGNSFAINGLVITCGGCSTQHPTYTGLVVQGNINGQGQCIPPAGVTNFDVTITYNVMSVGQTACSSASNPTASNNAATFVGSPFVDAAHGNLHLTSSSTAAQNFWVGCSSVLAIDFDGTARGSTCNAGADS